MSAPSPAPAAPFLTDSIVFDWKAQSFRADLIFILPLSICLIARHLAGPPGRGIDRCRRSLHRRLWRQAAYRRLPPPSHDPGLAGHWRCHLRRHGGRPHQLHPGAHRRGSRFRLWNAFLASGRGQLGRAAVHRLSSRRFRFSLFPARCGGPFRTGHGRRRLTDPHFEYPAPPLATAAHRPALRRALSQGRAPGPAFLRGTGRPLAHEAESRPQRSALRHSPRCHSHGQYRNLPPLRLCQRILDTHDRLARPQARTERHREPGHCPHRRHPCRSRAWPASFSPI